LFLLQAFRARVGSPMPELYCILLYAYIAADADDIVVGGGRSGGILRWATGDGFMLAHCTLGPPTQSGESGDQLLNPGILLNGRQKQGILRDWEY